MVATAVFCITKNNSKMKKQTFTILFVIRKARTGKKGETPILVRITVNGTRDEIKLKRAVRPENWNAKKQVVKECDKLSAEINKYLNSVRLALLNIHRELEQDEKAINARIIKDIYLGKGYTKQTVLKMLSDHNDEMKGLIGRGFAQKTLDRYTTTEKHLKEFIKLSYKREDMFISEVDYEFIRRFNAYLQIDKRCNHNSAVKHLKALRKIVRIALLSKQIKESPFAHYRLIENPVEKCYLTRDELDRIKGKAIKVLRLDRVRDIFLFCCHTGLSYIDTLHLKPEHILCDSDGYLWIHIHRQKTGNLCRIPLLAEAKTILDKYKDEPECVQNGVLLPVISNQRLNTYLEELADICGITKHITMHMARH